MPVFEITAPDGRTFEITAPEGATREQALEYAKANYQPKEPNRLGALAGGVNRGVAGVLGLPMDTIENVYNLGKAAVGTVATAAGYPDLAPELTRGTPLSSQWIAEKMGKIGIGTGNPSPEDPASRMLHTGGMIASGSVFPQPGTVAQSVAGAARTALPAAIGGAVAGEIDPRLTGLGAMAPAVARQAGSGIRTALANPQTVAKNIDTFKQAGTTPTIGQATERTFFQALENLVVRFPGGLNVMRAFGKNQQAQLGATARTGVSAEDAGRAIETGIKGSGGFIDRTHAIWKRLDNELAAKVPPSAAVTPVNTVKVLDDLTTPVVGAENTTATLVNPKLAALQQALLKDLQANNKVMPFEALRAVRSQVGSQLDNSLVSGIPSGELKRVYAALSKDMEVAANTAGAGREFARQNHYYAARMDRIENVLERVIGKTPEDTFKAFMPTDPNQATKVRTVMRSLPEGDRKIVTNAIVERLGKATPGHQNVVGDVFSSNTFMTNWNRLSDGAKAQIFSDPAMRRNMDSLAAATNNIKEGSGVLANPSGTGQVGAWAGLAYLAAQGQVIPAAGLIAGSYAGARMLTSPKVVSWLATPVSQVKNPAAHLARLGVIFNQSKDEELKAELAQFLSSAQEQQ